MFCLVVLVTVAGQSTEMVNAKYRGLYQVDIMYIDPPQAAKGRSENVRQRDFVVSVSISH